MEDNWTPPSDAEVTDWSPPSDAQVVDETVKKKVTPSPSQVQSSSNGLNLLSGVIPSGKALLTGQKGESVQIDQKPIDLTNAPIAEDESTRTDKFIRKPIDKKKVEEVYALSKQNESLVDEFAKSHFVLDNLSQTEAVKQINDLYAKREQAKDAKTAQAIDDQIEVLKSQPVEKQPSIQEAILQNAQKYGSQPQDFNRPEIPMNPLTPNQILERNGMKTANTVGELHDRYIESANKLNQLRPELDKTATELDKFKKEARTADFKTDKSGNKTLEGLADVPEAFGHGFGGTMKSIEQGFVNLLGDKQDRIDYAKKRYLEDNILYPTRTKGMATSGSEMVGGVAPYVISTAVLPETALLGHVIINGLTMGASGYGNGYYEMFAKQKQQGRSDEEADAIAMQNAKFEGAKETAIGASLPFMGGAGSKLFLAPAEKSAMKQFLATQGVIIPTFTAGKLASNVYQKYGLGEKDVNLGDGLAETAENGLILGAMMEFAHKAPTKLKELYRANLSEQYPSIQQAVDKAVQDGVMDASQMGAFTEKLKRDYAVFNAMPKDITTEQKLAIEPEVKQIIELSSREPSAVESPEITKDKIVQLQKQIAEKLGTPLTEKEMKSYEKLQEIKGDKEDKLTPSEKLELKHYEKRIETAKENEAKLAEEKKVAEAEAPLTNVGVEEGSGGAEGDVKYTEEQTQEYKQRGFEQNDNGIWVHKGTNPVIKKVLNGWVGKLFASNGGTHAGNIHKEGSGIAGSLGKFNFKTGKTPFLDLVFGKDKTDSDYFVTLSHEMGHDIFERLTPEEKAIIEKNQNLTDSAKAHKENRDNKGELENNASDAEESWSDYVSAFLGKKLFDVAIEEYNAIPKEILPILEANVKIPKEVLSELGVEQSLKETTKAATPKNDSAIQSGGEQKLPDQKEVPIEQKQEVSDDKLSRLPKNQPKSTWQQEQDAIDSDAALTNEQKQEKKVEVTAKALEGADKIEINKKQAILNAEKIDKGSGSHVKKMSLGELNELARDMISNEKYYQDKLQDAQGVYNLAVERIQELSESYHKAKADGSNPELVKAVEDLLGKQKESSPTPQTGKDIGGELLNSVNPTGGVFSNYSAEEIDKLPLGENITTYDKTSNKKQDEKITVYRGVPKDASDDIVSGDFVTTNKKLAQDYAGTGKVISKEVRADEILDDKTEPLGEEYILRQKPLTEGAKDIPSEDWSRDVESTAKALEGVQKENADKFVNDFANIDIPFRQKNIQAEMDSEVKKQLFPNEKSRRKYAETIYSAVVRSGNFPKILSEAYHKAKKDGSNPELVKAVEQSLKETTQSETKVAEKGVEEPITEEIKTAIDNGEITREQVDGFTEQDESAIEDIERKAESEDETELNSAIEQADKLIGETITRSESKTEPSNEKVEGGEVKKTLVTKRAYEGSFREGVKKELEAIGLTRETENFEKAEIEAKKFFDEYGEDVAIEAMKAKDIEGALGAFVWNEITKSVDKKLSEATDTAEIEQLQKKQAEILDIWGKQQRGSGAFNAAMAKIYETSELGYSYEKQKEKWEGKFGEPMPKDIAEKFKQYDTELSDLKKRITEAEKKVKEAEEKQAFDNIVAEVRQKPRTERSGKRKIAEGLDELTNALGVKLSAVGDKKASATKALIKIGEGLIEEGIATAKNVAEKIREYVEDKFKGKIDIKEYEPDVLKHFEETLPKITERNGKIHIPDKLIKELVKNGAETIEDLVSQVKEIAKEDFPDITDREIRDSITKYGKTQNPTKDEILSKISRMKRIGRLISQLEDVQNKIRPLKSGLQRERMDAEERAMNKQLREELRNLPVDEETLAGQIRTVLDARKQGVQNRIEDLQREIEKGEKTPKNQRTIADDEALTKLKEQLEKVKAEHQEKFAEQNEAEKEAKRLSMAKKNTQKRIEDLTTRLREGNFSKVAKKEIKEDAELTKLRAEKIRIQEEFDKEFHKQELLNKKGVEKLKDRLWEIWSLPRALMATGEMSFVGVQGLINTIAHPIESAKAMKRAIEFAFSEKKTEQWLNEIKSQEYYPIMKKSKLSLTEPNAELTAREELFYSGWTNMIWNALGRPLKLKSDLAYEKWKELNPMRGVERASVGYLDTQRVSRFLDGMEMLKQKGITYEENPQAYKDVADVVNTFTGRASLGKLDMIAPTLSKVFFSPRNWASALKTATPYALYHFGKMRAGADGFKPSTAQKMAISDLSKFVGVTTSMVMMAAATLNNDDDESTGVEFDPRSSDFMKIKIGDKRIDPWGGKIQQIIFSSRVLMDALHEVSPNLSEGGYKKKDEVMPLGVEHKSPTLESLSRTQATNKLAPTMALLNKYASTKIGKDGKRKDEFGNDFELSEEAKKMLKPIYWGTVSELLKEDPSALNGLLAFYAFFGGGVNIYGKKKEKKKD